jgi:glycosyltransferase involved in cell wall biosynthesis
MKNNIYFLIPAYNEASIIGEVLQNLIHNEQYNIVVVNDGSKDNTAEIVKSFKNVTLINHVINRGQGAGLATGLDYLSQVEDCDYVVTYDADGQHRLEDALQMVEVLKENPELDIIIGSRFIETTRTNVPLTRKITLKLGVVFLKFVYGLKITDAHNGLRVIRKRVLVKMIPKLDNFSHASEMTYLIKAHNLNFKEFPTHIIYSEYSLSKGQSSMNSVRIALTTLWHKIGVLVFE